MVFGISEKRDFKTSLLRALEERDIQEQLLEIVNRRCCRFRCASSSASLPSACDSSEVVDNVAERRDSVDPAENGFPSRVSHDKSDLTGNRHLNDIIASHQEAIRTLEGDKNKLRDENKQLTEEKHRLNDTVQKLESDLRHAQRDSQQAQNGLRQAHSELRQTQAACSEWEQKYRDLELNQQELQRNLADSQRSRDRLEGDKVDLQQRLTSLESELERSRREIADLKRELSNVFSGAKGLLTAFQQKASLATKETFKGVVHNESDFEAFIAGLSQVNAPECVWKAMHACVRERRGDELKMLHEIFLLTLKLVNKTKSEPLFRELPTEVGEVFDYEKHTAMPGSKNQGRVTAVHLRGFENLYNHTVVCASLVSVG